MSHHRPPDHIRTKALAPGAQSHFSTHEILMIEKWRAVSITAACEKPFSGTLQMEHLAETPLRVRSLFSLLSGQLTKKSIAGSASGAKREISQQQPSAWVIGGGEFTCWCPIGVVGQHSGAIGERQMQPPKKSLFPAVELEMRFCTHAALKANSNKAAPYTKIQRERKEKKKVALGVKILAECRQRRATAKVALLHTTKINFSGDK